MESEIEIGFIFGRSKLPKSEHCWFSKKRNIGWRTEPHRTLKSGRHTFMNTLIEIQRKVVLNLKTEFLLNTPDFVLLLINKEIK